MFRGRGQFASQALLAEELDLGHQACGQIVSDEFELDRASDSFHYPVGPYDAISSPNLGLFSDKDILPTSERIFELGIFSRPLTPALSNDQHVEPGSFESNSEALFSISDRDVDGLSSFECSAKGSRNMTFASDKTSDVSGSSNPDTASEASFTSVTLNDPIDCIPDALHEMLLGDVHMVPPTGSRQALGPLTCQPAAGPLRKPKQPRSVCNSCGRTFSRLSDLGRHQRDIHESGSVIYKCKICKHGKFGRRDKVKEHCKSQKHGEVLVVEVASNPEVALAVHASRRRQNVRSYGGGA